MENLKVQTITMYYYIKDGRECVTPSADIAVARRDEETEIKVCTLKDGKEEYSTLNVN